MIFLPLLIKIEAELIPLGFSNIIFQKKNLKKNLKIIFLGFDVLFYFIFSILY